MANDDDPFETLQRGERRAIANIIDAHKTAVIVLHAQAAKLTGSAARDLRAMADGLEQYAESLKEQLKKTDPEYLDGSRWNQ